MYLVTNLLAPLGALGGGEPAWIIGLLGGAREGRRTMGLGGREATGKPTSWLTAASNKIGWDRSVACEELKGRVGGRFTFGLAGGVVEVEDAEGVGITGAPYAA